MRYWNCLKCCEIVPMHILDDDQLCPVCAEEEVAIEAARQEAEAQEQERADQASVSDIHAEYEEYGYPIEMEEQDIDPDEIPF